MAAGPNAAQPSNSTLSLLSNEPQPLTTISKNVEEVRLAFTALDRQGHALDGIGPQDLDLADDRTPVSELTSFVRTSDLPLRLALLVDVSESVAKGLSEEQQASLEFLQTVVRPGRDQVLLMAFASRVMLQTPYPGKGEGLKLVSTYRAGGQTALYDAICAASSNDVIPSLDDSPARRAIVLLSDGEDTESYHTFKDAISCAQRAEVSIYAITIHSSETGRRGDKTLEELTSLTGGMAYILSRHDQLSSAFAQIEQDLRSQYVLTYRRSLAPPHSGFHSLQLTVRNAENAKLNYRRGYFAHE